VAWTRIKQPAMERDKAAVALRATLVCGHSEIRLIRHLHRSFFISEGSGASRILRAHVLRPLAYCMLVSDSCRPRHCECPPNLDGKLELQAFAAIIRIRGQSESLKKTKRFSVRLRAPASFVA
jgi:hypothetical protein